MKKFFLLSSAAIFALSALTSCDLFKQDPDEDDSFNTPGIEVEIKNAKTSTTDAATLTGMTDNSVLANDKDGKMIVAFPAEGTMKGDLTISGSNPAKLNGPLVVKSEKLPQASKPVSGERSNPGIILKVNNPASQPVKFGGKIDLDGKKLDLPETTLPANKKDITLGYFIEGNEAPVDVDQTIALPANEFGGLKTNFTKLEVVETKFEPATKAIAPAASYSYQVEAKYCIPLAFPKGTKIHVDAHFKDLNIDLSSIQDKKMHEYALKLDVTSTIPFDIELAATADGGLSAKTESAVKGGKIGSPVTTTASLLVKNPSGESVLKLSKADLGVDLTAIEDGAMLNKNQTISVNAKTFKIIKL